MSDRAKVMTGGKPWKLILELALPLMFGNIFQQLYTVMDTLIVGRVLGVGAALTLPGILGRERIFYAEILAWIGADLILISAYYIRVHKLSRTLQKP